MLTSEWRESCFGGGVRRILHPRLDRGEIIIDPARFVADPEKAKRFPELPYVTLRLAYMACEYFNADLGLAIVRAEHQAFYRRVFLHETIAEPRFFPGLLKPVGLMAADFPAMREKVFERYPMMRSTAFERRMLFERRSERRRPLDVDGLAVRARPRSFRTPEAAWSRADRPARRRVPIVTARPLLRPAAIERLKPPISADARLPSPSRHIYNPLTIAVAFRRLPAFDRVWQHPIKVDGTFA